MGKDKVTLLKYSQTGLANLGIISIAQVGCHLFPGLIQSQGCPVGTVAGHGLHYIGDRNNTGFQQDLVRCQAQGITRAVDTLVVLDMLFNTGAMFSLRTNAGISRELFQ